MWAGHAWHKQGSLVKQVPNRRGPYREKTIREAKIKEEKLCEEGH